jgi:hypothetical protein
MRPLESSAWADAPTCTREGLHCMTYGDFLKPWVVVWLRSKMQRTDVARFHHFSDAEGHAQVLRQLNPDRQYIVVFEPPAL